MNRLRKLREEKGDTQDQVAKAVGVSKRSYIYWEQGKRQIKPDKAQALADHFGVSVGYLLGFNSEEVSAEEIKLHNQITEQLEKEVCVHFLDFLAHSNIFLSDKQIQALLLQITSASEINQDYQYYEKDKTKVKSIFSLMSNYHPALSVQDHKNIYTTEKIDEHYDLVQKIINGD